MKFEFKARHTELALLERLWHKQGAQFFVLYGRRRIGKTALIKEWIDTGGSNSIYWMARTSPERVLLRNFSQTIYNFANPTILAPEDFAYASWEQAFQQVGALAAEQRIGLFIDEFTYLLQTRPDILSILQDVWDHQLSHTRLFLCLSGSHMGMMKKEILAPRSPLYARASAQLHLQPIPFGNMALFFPNYRPADRVALYALFGGVPAYWERITSSLSISQNIKQELLTPGNLMQAEPELLLQDFLRDPRYYVGILKAIAVGRKTSKEIAAYATMPESNLPKYLNVLIDSGFVRRMTPITKPETSRISRYVITDPYLRFYYRFLEARQNQLAMGVIESALGEIKKHLVDYIGTYTWEEICREWVLRAAPGILPFTPDRVGSDWSSQYQCDVVGINTMEKTLLLGECKWTKNKASQKTLKKLVQITPKIISKSPRGLKWKVYYLGFSKSGWTADAHQYAQRLNGENVAPPDANWESVGIQLLDLPEVEKNLQAWS